MSALSPALQWDPGKFEVQKKLGNFVQYFQVNLPSNNMGIPLQLIDPVPLMEELLECETTDDMPDHIVESAIMNIDFEDGYPTIDGLPIWERLDGERLDYYKLFKEYREMPELLGTRALAKLADNHGIASKFLHALSKVYHWQIRCKAYDIYQKMIRERKRQYAIEKLESRHSKAAELLLERGLAYVEEHPEQLTPKIALSMIEMGMKAGRLALGLSADKPGTGTSGGTNININQNTGINTGAGSIEMNQQNKAQSEGKNEDVNYLQSILHILDSSGAFEQAKQEIIDADFSEVDDQSTEAVEGT